MKQQLTAPATLTQIATAYGVCRQTMRKYLKIAGIYQKHNKKKQLYTPKEINLIIQELGHPDIYQNH